MKFNPSNSGIVDMGTMLNQQDQRAKLVAKLTDAFLQALALKGTDDEKRYCRKLADVAAEVFEQQ